AQALSGEIVLNRLLDMMMHIVIENAGAEKGFLLLPKQGSWFIEAEGHIDNSDASVLQSLPLEKSEQVSSGIIHFVARTRENVVLNNVAQDGRFTRDAHIVKHRPKSVLCIPLVNQGQLTGILYLENNLIQGAFTSKRLEALNLLSSQIAISIKNSLLYNKLEEKVAERTAELVDINKDLKLEIEERKQTEEALRAEEEKWRSLTENAPDHIMLLDLDYNIRFINHTDFSFSIEDVIGKSSLDLVTPDQHQIVIDCFERVLQSRKPDRYETMYISTGGGNQYFEVRVAPVMSTDGSIIGLISSSTDVTDRKKAEETIQEKAFLLDSSSSIIGTCDLDRRMMYINPAFLNNLGFDSLSEVLGRPFTEFWMVQDKLEEIMTALMGDGGPGQWSGELKMKRKDGSLFNTHVSAATVLDSSGKPRALMSTSLDITELKKVEEDLLFMKTLSDQTSEVIAIKDKSFKYIVANPVCVDKLSKVSGRKQIIGSNDYQILPKEIADELRETDKRVVINDEIVVAEELVGEKIYLSRKFPIKDYENNTVAMGIIATDITDRKKAEAEKETLEDQLRQAHKMEAIGTLAGGIAHEFNNILGIIVGNTELAMGGIPEWNTA
ncbi:MAG: PAS domain S-box protein, partial [bacterium]|nr:PAS domain S-box protein [bacterium]